jgi:hypothetical protein
MELRRRRVKILESLKTEETDLYQTLLLTARME